MSRKTLTIRLEPELAEAARAVAAAERRSLSNLVEVAVLEYVSRCRAQVAQERSLPSLAEAVASENVRGESPPPTTYYIPGWVGGHEVYLRLSESGAELLPAEKVDVDPTSQVAAPPLPARWADQLRWKGRPLSVVDVAHLAKARVAYTRATVRGARFLKSPPA